MSCPACGEAVESGRERCPACGAVVAPRVEGALAPDPASITPPAAGKREPLREIPGLRKRERTWKDEVKERVRHRRQKKAGAADLPLFGETEAAAAPETAPAAAEAERPASAETSPVAARRESPVPAEPERGTSEQDEFETPAPDEHGLADLPLRPSDTQPYRPQPRRGAQPGPAERQAPSQVPHEDEPLSAAKEQEGEWGFELQPRPPEPAPVERPAEWQERLRAAALDLALLGGLWTLVVYFASRAARVGVLELRPGWAYLAGYLAFLGLVYATYFTGTTGQTLGKMWTGLRVVDAEGRPPGYLRALLRATVGAAGTALVGLGQLPVVFDPARRALHDRLFRTRVVKR